MNKKLYRIAAAITVGTLAVSSFVLVASATHSWGNYHWARTANPFTLKLGDNFSSAWDPYLTQASTDWSLSNVLNTLVVTGSTNPKNCRAVAGRVEACNSKYGNNGWLGLASIWASGNHITKGTVKVNDTYFNTAKYNTPAWKSLVVCQEIGHTFGLDHQDEISNNTNIGTCMDYTGDPDGSLNNQLSNVHPNQHDYDMLETIYAHLDATTTINQSAASKKGYDVDHSDPSSWGREIRQSADKKASLFEKDFGNGNKIFTFVIWAE